MDFGWQIGQYGGITVMFPAAIVVAVWLWVASCRRVGLEWLLTLAIAYTLVGVSKIAFKGWGIGFETLDIAVLSGHAMNTSLVVIVSLSLLARQIDPRWRWPVAVGATLWTWWFAVKCVAPVIHPLSEAVAGALVGSVGAWLFLRRLEQFEVRRLATPALAAGLMLMMIAASLPKYTAEHLLNHFAISLSGAERPHLTPPWREPPES
ncbi:MAG: hypothetical protein ACRYF9_08745 [Janthinobacterium lividum]|uniref:hypothetical protein n=1 Tax=Pseudomonas TaxID=286 RepID=UPI001CFBA3DA|nr:hypothetical protein [Pseudomonas baltica]